MTTLSPAAEKIIAEKRAIRGPLEEVFRRVYSKNARLLTRKPNPAEPEEVRGVDLYIPAPVSVPSYTEGRLRRLTAEDPALRQWAIVPQTLITATADALRIYQDEGLERGSVIIPFIVAKIPPATPAALRNAIYVLMEDVTSGQWGLLDGGCHDRDGAELFGLTSGEFTAAEEAQLRNAAESAGYEIVSIGREHSERYRRDVYILRVSFNRTAPEIPF